MARIFISYNRQDSEFVRSVSDQLKTQGHDIAIDVDALAPGQDLRRTLASALKESEVFVVFLSESSKTSQYVLSEIGAARAYSEESERMLVIPILIDDIPIPSIVQDLFVVTAYDRNVQEIARSVETAIASFFGKKAARDERESALSKKIEQNAAEYIEEAITLLKNLEKRNRSFGTVWYFVGFAALLVGVVFATFGLASFSALSNSNWADFAVVTLKSIVVVGLLGACSKYAFTLGRSYIDESLKSADRMHAISFGKFYLRVFGSNASWPEVKEAFQHWNIDRSSTFSNLATSEFDPKMFESLIELAKVVSSEKAKKKP